MFCNERVVLHPSLVLKLFYLNLMQTIRLGTNKHLSLHMSGLTLNNCILDGVEILPKNYAHEHK